MLAAHNSNLLHLPHCIITNFLLLLLKIDAIFLLFVSLSPKHFPFLNSVPSSQSLLLVHCRVVFHLLPDHFTEAPSWGLFFAPSLSHSPPSPWAQLPHQTPLCLLMSLLLFILSPLWRTGLSHTPLPVLSHLSTSHQ